MIHLTPFAWRSGQTSSMLGGAQFKATLLTVKAFASNLQCKMTDNSCHKAKGWQAAFCSMKVNSSQELPIPASLCIKVGRGQHTEYRSDPEKVSSRTANITKAGTGEYSEMQNPCFVHTLLRHCHSIEFHTAREINRCPLLLSSKSSSNFF